MKFANMGICLVVVALAGCASGVKLDDIPVEDKQPTAAAGAATTGAGAGSAATGISGVTAVDLGKTGPTAAGPVGSRVVYFDYDSFSVKTEYQGVIDVNARYLKTGSGRRATVEGHTDERGGREYNLALGQKRAEAVRRAMVLLGVSDGQLEAVSFGKEKPAAVGHDEVAMAKNRRAEIVYRP